MLDIYIEEVLTDEMSMNNSLLNIDLVEMHLVFSKRYGKNANLQQIWRLVSFFYFPVKSLGFKDFAKQDTCLGE